MTVIRVDKKDRLFGIIDQLQHLAQKYLVHRFMVCNDTYYWKNFIQNSPFHIFWVDYSQNINLTEKFQVQSADYSGKQQTLHNTVLHSPNNKTTKYMYHLSDGVFTFCVVEDIILNHTEVIEQGILVLRSDICEEQY